MLIRGLIRALIRGSQDPHLALTPDRDKRGVWISGIGEDGDPEDSRKKENHGGLCPLVPFYAPLYYPSLRAFIKGT